MRANLAARPNPVKYWVIAIEGGASGADFIAKQWALSRQIECKTFRANWRLWGLSAGPRRNKQMLNEGHPDLVVAFMGGDGTKNMLEQAMLAKVECMCVGWVYKNERVS